MLQIQCGEFRVKLLELEDIGSRLAGRAVARTRPTRSRQSRLTVVRYYIIRYMQTAWRERTSTTGALGAR